MGKIISKVTRITIEFTPDEVNALKHILNSYTGGDYHKYCRELIGILS